jgi:hypothetical protein
MDRIIDDAVRKPSGEKDGERGLFLLGRFFEEGKCATAVPDGTAVMGKEARQKDSAQVTRILPFLLFKPFDSMFNIRTGDIPLFESCPDLPFRLASQDSPESFPRIRSHMCVCSVVRVRSVTTGIQIGHHRLL